MTTTNSDTILRTTSKSFSWYLFVTLVFLSLFNFILPNISPAHAANNRADACDTTPPPGLGDKCTKGIFDRNTCEFIPSGNFPWTDFTLSGNPRFEKTSYPHNGDTHILKISPSDGKQFVAGTRITFNTTPGKTYCASWRWGPNTDSSGKKNPFEKTMGLDPSGQTDPSAGSIVWGSTVNKTSRQLDYDPVGVDVNYNTDIKTVATGNTMTLFIKTHFTASENSHVQIDQVNVFDEGFKTGGTTAPTPTQPSGVNPTPSRPPNPTPVTVSCQNTLPAPEIISPAHNFIETSLVALGQQKIEWKPVTGASGYAVRIDDLTDDWGFGTSCLDVKPNHPGDVCQDDINGTSTNHTFENNHTYAIWVAAENSCGWGGNFSGMKVVGVPQVCTNIQSAPTLIFPVSNTIPAGNQTIKWTAVPGATGYALRINDKTDKWNYIGDCSRLIDPALKTPNDKCFDHQSTSTLSYPYTFQPGHSYGIWVAAENTCGWGGYHSGKDITVEGPQVVTTTLVPPTPTMCSPLPILAWRDGVHTTRTVISNNGVKVTENIALHLKPITFSGVTVQVRTNDGDPWVNSDSSQNDYHIITIENKHTQAITVQVRLVNTCTQATETLTETVATVPLPSAILTPGTSQPADKSLTRDLMIGGALLGALVVSALVVGAKKS